MTTASERILKKYDEEVSALGFYLHDFLLSQLKDIVEFPDVSANIIGYGYGPGYKDMICTIIPSKKGIKLGLNKGSELPDPSTLLTGSGKVHKYAEIKSVKDIHNPPLKTLLKEATKAWRLRTAAGKKKK